MPERSRVRTSESGVSAGGSRPSLFVFHLWSSSEPRSFRESFWNLIWGVSSGDNAQTLTATMGPVRELWHVSNPLNGEIPIPTGIQDLQHKSTTVQMEKYMELILLVRYLHYGSTALRSLIYVDVGEPTSHPCSMTGMIQDHHFFLGSCRARSRLRRSSKRFVFEWQFPHIGEWVKAKTLGVFKTRQTQQQQTNTQPKPNQNNPKRHPGNYVKHYAFRKVPKPLSTASRCYSKSHS